ncbi:MAG: WD40 repeat domain-containing protein [Bacteroidia bacterium]
MRKIFLLFLVQFGAFSFLTAQKTFTEPYKILTGHGDDMDALAVSPEKGYLATGSWDKLVNIYNLDSPYQLIRTLTGHQAPVTDLFFNKTGSMLASGSNDFMVKLWDSLFQVRNFEGHHGNVNTLLFDNSGKYLFSGSDDKTIIAWDIASGKPFKTINNFTEVNSIAFGNDPRFLFAAGNEPKIKVYNLATLQVARTFDGHTAAVNCIDISKNNLYLISGSNDKSARIWDIKTGKEIRKLPVDCWKVIAVIFSDDSRYAATGCNDGSIKVWEVATGNLISQTPASGNSVHEIAFLKDNKFIAVTNVVRNEASHGLRIWKTGIDPNANTEIVNPKTNTEKPKMPAVKPANMRTDSLKKSNSVQKTIPKK